MRWRGAKLDRPIFDFRGEFHSIARPRSNRAETRDGPHKQAMEKRMTTAPSDIALTEQAARRIHAILANESPGAVFRVSVEGGGCSGFQYHFGVDPAPGEEDALVEQAGARVAIDPSSMGFLAGARIDFVDDLMGQSFRIENPNAVASCGCGTSFAV
jgi:iron-sulfur cluster assembly accessory protein